MSQPRVHEAIQSGTARQMNAAAVAIQARARGMAVRKKKVEDAAVAKSVGMTFPKRLPGHPTDRQLIAQALARKRAEAAQKSCLSESSFDGESTLVGIQACNKQTVAVTPPPDGLERLTVSYATPRDMHTAFCLLDEGGSGVLQRVQARAFLRCMGWCVTNAEMDNMLNGTPAGVPSQRSKYIPELWTLANLQDVLSRCKLERNSSVDVVHEALVRLANGRQRISRNRLIEITAANTSFVNDNLKDVLRHIGVGDKASIDCRTLAENVCARICIPPPVVDKYCIKIQNDVQP